MARGGVSERLRGAGFRLTGPRRAVARVVEGSAPEQHFSPELVLERARTIHPELGRATVYRTLELFTRVGVLRPIRAPDGRPCYTRAEGGHHHVVCAGCGRVVEFAACASRALARRLARELDFEITSHLLEFYGRCRNCRS